MGKWDTFGGIPGIVFPDGNKWTKVRASRPRSEPHVAEPVPGRSTLSHVFFIALVLIAIVALAVSARQIYAPLPCAGGRRHAEAASTERDAQHRRLRGVVDLGRRG